MEPIKQIRSKTVVMPNDDIDTDQIIPARYLTTTTKDGLGKNLFNDWRYDRNGKERADFVLTRPENRGAQILVGGHNFGCGSSREHAHGRSCDLGAHAVPAEHDDLLHACACSKRLMAASCSSRKPSWSMPFMRQ